MLVFKAKIVVPYIALAVSPLIDLWKIRQCSEFQTKITKLLEI